MKIYTVEIHGKKNYIGITQAQTEQQAISMVVSAILKNSKETKLKLQIGEITAHYSIMNAALSGSVKYRHHQLIVPCDRVKTYLQKLLKHLQEE